jgi:hypothetical protein
MTTLRTDICDTYNTKFVKIPNETKNIGEYIKAKCLCAGESRTHQRVLKNGKISNVNDLFKVHKKGSAVYQGSGKF